MLVTERNGLKSLVISQSQVARTMDIASGWGKLRIGATLALDGPEASIGGTPRLMMGLSNGVSNLPFSSTPGHFLGMRTNITTMGYSSSFRSYALGDDECQLYHNAGGVVTTKDISIVSVGNMGLSDATAVYDEGAGNGLSTFYLDFERVDATTMRILLASQRVLTGGNQGMKEEKFKESMTLEDIEDANVFGTQIATLPRSMTFDEGTDGVLDSICIAWDQPYDLEISRVAFARLA
jgi:hypothetical protein